MLNILLLSGIKLVGIRPYSRTFYNGFPLAEHYKIFFSRKFIFMVLTVFLPTTTLLACSRHLVNTAEQNKTKGTMVAVEQNEEACFGRVRQAVVKTEQNKCDSSSREKNEETGLGRVAWGTRSLRNPTQTSLVLCSTATGLVYIVQFTITFFL